MTDDHGWGHAPDAAKGLNYYDTSGRYARGQGGSALSAAEVDALRAEVADLRARLAKAAPRRAVVEMDRAITMLHHRVEDMREGGFGTGTEDMGHLAEELLDLRTALDAIRAPERFQALSAGVEMLSRKIDVLADRTVSPVEMSRLQAQSTELKALVLRTVSGAGLQPIAERLAACAEQVARTSSESARRVAEASSAFERNAQALISRVDAYEASARDERSAAHEMRQSVETNLHGLHDRLDKVSDHLSALAPAAGAEVGERLAGLIARLEAARDAEGAAGPLAEVVEHHLLTLTDRFQDAHARLERLDGIETLLAQMAEDMRRARHVPGAVTQETVDAAVDEAVDAVSRKVSTDAGGPAVVGLKRGLAALEARQDEVERRASELLGESIARGIEERTVVLGRAADDVWVPHPLQDERLADGYAADLNPADLNLSAAEDETRPEVYEPQAHDHDVDWPVEEAAGADRFADMEPEAFEADAPDHAAEAPFAAAYAQPHAAAEPQAPFPEPEIGDFRPGSDMPSRPRKVSLGRRRPPHLQAGEREEDARPRVDRLAREARRPAASRMSPAVIALAALTALAAAAAGTAWTHRDAILSQASRAVTQVKTAAMPAAPRSTADLPAPTGPQALRTAALEGNLAAAYEVGVRFADGVGIAQDLDAGIAWLGYAVSRGYAPAAYRLGSLYENSLRNVDEALRFYTWAAEQGNVRAMHNLAVLYSQGSGVATDWSEALKWFRRAADLGLKDSQHNLGIIFARGLSGASDLAEALTWFNIAARQGDTDSAEKRDALAREADETVMARAKKAADAFVPKPINESANVVAVLPEWNASEIGEHIASAAPASGAAPSSVLFSGSLMASNR